MKPDTIPAAWLPLAAQKVTVVCASNDYDDMIFHVSVARDWRTLGEAHLRQAGDIDDDYRILAVFPGHIKSDFGSAIVPA